jgi:hypothetical protein
LVDVEALTNELGNLIGGSPFEVNCAIAGQNTEFLEVATVSVTQQHDPACV